MASRKKVELSSELKELITTRIAVLPKEQFEAFEKYIVQLKKDRTKAEKELPKLITQMEAMGYTITKPGEEKKLEPVPAVEALKEVVYPDEKKAAEEKPEEKKPEEKKKGWMGT